MYFHFLVRRSLKNLVYKGICCRASPKGIVISNFLNISRNRAKYHSFSFLEGTRGRYGASFTEMVDGSLLLSLATWLLVFGSQLTSSLSYLSFFYFSLFIFLFIHFFSLCSFSSSLSSSFSTSLSVFSSIFSTLSHPWLLVTTTLHSSFGFFSVFATKFPVDFSSSFLVNCPTWISRLFIADSVLLWLDIDTCINWVNVSFSLVVLSYKLGPWLGGRLDGALWFLLN